MVRARERAVGLALLLPGLFFSSVFGSLMAYAGVRGAEAHDPDLVLPLLSLIATGVGISWMLSPLVAGVSLSESHDVSRLLHFPLPLLTLVAASLVGNLLQPVVLAALPVLASLSLALSRSAAALPFALAGSLLSLLFLLAAAQVSGLVLHGLSRRRRFQDVAVFLVIGLGFLMSMAPIVLFSGGARFLGHALRGLVASDLVALSPFAWGLRAAVHAGRGEVLAFVGWAAAQAAAIAAAAAVSAVLIERIYRGELDLGGRAREETGRAVMRLPGRVGALLEKDLRVAWRDPATKATLFLSCATPLFWLFVFTRTSGGLSSSGLLMLAMLVGASAFGNAFGLEGRGIALLFGFPVPDRRRRRQLRVHPLSDRRRPPRAQPLRGLGGGRPRPRRGRGRRALLRGHARGGRTVRVPCVAPDAARAPPALDPQPAPRARRRGRGLRDAGRRRRPGPGAARARPAAARDG